MADITLETLKAEISALPEYKDLDLKTWDKKIQYRAAHVKFDSDIQHAINCYIDSIPKLKEEIARLEYEKDTWHASKRMIDLERITDKLAVCLKEQELRKAKLVERTPHHTDYYIDSGMADDTGNGLTTGAAYKTINKYTTTEVRSAGDRGMLRANVTWDQSGVDITFDESGTSAGLIELVGCGKVADGDEDPWSDDVATKPIIDFGDAAYQLTTGNKEFWRFERIKLTNCGDSNGFVYIVGGSYISFVACDLLNSNSASIEGFNLMIAHAITFTDCTMTNVGYASIRSTQGSFTATNCTCAADGDTGTAIGMYVAGPAEVRLDNCTFTGTFSSYQLSLTAGAVVKSRNCDWCAVGNNVTGSSTLYSEDSDGTFESTITTWLQGTITRGTTSPRSGGADSFAIMAPSSSCGLYNPLVLGDPMSGFAKIWLDAGSYTVSVYARDPDNWATQPGNDADQETFYIKTSELDAADSAARVERKSAQISTGGAAAWVEYTVAITPARTGWVYVLAYLGAYESGKTIEVDILPVIS